MKSGEMGLWNEMQEEQKKYKNVNALLRGEEREIIFIEREIEERFAFLNYLLKRYRY